MEFMKKNGDLVGFNGDLMGFRGDFMAILTDSY